ncbi:uncharacterized protein [Physcomitrium patens]|uniref:WRC domain-containing protein n=1 Tax=Physcomitrium patens TaxID=3218 RepID=A0A7I4FUB7_PHYPA|nr:uncharacterized protein LOC112285506 isoform X2 [Physcomitrium patens]|eukprot:XP_024382174.1 uncharacterized protein LOC112285506 isoform X2 [Physcomitrella patens]
MRIRKGHRCLPLPPADRSFLQEIPVNPEKEVCSNEDRKDDAKQALLRLVALAAAPVADIISGPQYLEHANGSSVERTPGLDNDIEKTRVSADDNFNGHSSMQDTGIDSAVRNQTATPPRTKSVFTRHKPVFTAGTARSNTSTIEMEDKADLLLQSLRNFCSKSGITGVSACDAVAQMIEQGLPGSNDGDESLTVNVAKLFRDSSKFIEHEGRGRYFFPDFPAREENESLITGGSEFYGGEAVSSSDMIEAARQLQNLQQSYSNLLGSGFLELSESPSFHDGDHKTVKNTIEGLVGQSNVGRDHKHVTAINQRASSNVSRSQKVIRADQVEYQCKRDDGKGWRCSRPAEFGITMCKYHREQIWKSQSRRKRAKFDAELTVPAEISSFTYVANARAVPNAVTTAKDHCTFLDEELPYDERRQFVKAKSLKSLLSINGGQTKIY